MLAILARATSWPAESKSTMAGSIFESSRCAQQSISTRCPFLAAMRKKSARSPLVWPLTLDSSGTSLAAATEAPACRPSTSFKLPTMNARGFVTPYLLTARTSYIPVGTEAEIVTLNCRGSGCDCLSACPSALVFWTAVIPGFENSSAWASSRSPPLTVTSRVVPTLPPGGKTLTSSAVGNCAERG